MLKIYIANNPILSPVPELSWTKQSVFNPGVVYDNGKFRMIFSGNDGNGCIQLGYADLVGCCICTAVDQCDVGNDEVKHYGKIDDRKLIFSLYRPFIKIYLILTILSNNQSNVQYMANLLLYPNHVLQLDTHVLRIKLQHLTTLRYIVKQSLIMGIQRLPPLDWLLHCRRTNVNMPRAGSRFHQESIADVTANHLCIRQRCPNA